MAQMKLDEAVDEAIAQAMTRDERVLVIGEDVHMLRAGLYTQFGASRVLPAPISEAAFVGAAVGAAMAGLRPVVEVMMVDFIAVAMDSLLNHMAKVATFSGGRWTCPLVLRAACGAGYGDGGQHGQSLWGMIAGVPGLTVVVPSTPADAAGLMGAAIEHDGPVVSLELPSLLGGQTDVAVAVSIQVVFPLLGVQLDRAAIALPRLQCPPDGVVVLLSLEEVGLPSQHGRRVGIPVGHEPVAIERRHLPVHLWVGGEACLHGKDVVRQVTVTIGDGVEAALGSQRREPRRPDVGRHEIGIGARLEHDLEQVP